MTDKPYTVGYGNDKKYYVNGLAPFGECSYYGGTLNADLSFENEDHAKVEALRCEIKALLQIN